MMENKPINQKIEYCKANNSVLASNVKEYWQAVNKGQAEIHMMDLAEKIYDAVNESTPKQLKAGEWHIPYEEIIDFVKLGEATSEYYRNNPNEIVNIDKWLVKVSTAMAESHAV